MKIPRRSFHVVQMTPTSRRDSVSPSSDGRAYDPFGYQGLNWATFVAYALIFILSVMLWGFFTVLIDHFFPGSDDPLDSLLAYMVVTFFGIATAFVFSKYDNQTLVSVFALVGTIGFWGVLDEAVTVTSQKNPHVMLFVYSLVAVLSIVGLVILKRTKGVDMWDELAPEFHALESSSRKPQPPAASKQGYGSTV